MEKFIELVELASGEVVAVGPFHKQDNAQAFADEINSYDNDVPAILGSRGGARLMTLEGLARELGVSVRRLKGTAERVTQAAQDAQADALDRWADGYAEEEVQTGADEVEYADESE